MLRNLILSAALVWFSGTCLAADRLILNEKWEELPPAAALHSPETPDLVTVQQPVLGGEHRATDYRYKHPRHGRYCKSDTTTVTLLINDPCTNCLVEVPVCVPVCCVKASPDICWTKGAFKREVVTYSWDCGYDVRIAFRNRTDALIVTYGQLQR